MTDRDPKWAWSRYTDQVYDWPSLEEVPNHFLQEGDAYIDIKHGNGQMIFDERNVRVYGESE